LEHTVAKAAVAPPRISVTLRHRQPIAGRVPNQSFAPRARRSPPTIITTNPT